MIWLLAAWGLHQRGRRAHAVGVYDAIVVPGCAVRPDGLPSPALERRIRGGVEAWRQGRAPRLVLTGGRGASGYVEAEVAARRCRELGVPERAIGVEATSSDTRGNATYSVSYVPRGRDARVLVVTDSYHVLRAQRLFGRVYADADAVAAPPAPHRIRAALREVPALLRAGARGWL